MRGLVQFPAFLEKLCGLGVAPQAFLAARGIFLGAYLEVQLESFSDLAVRLQFPGFNGEVPVLLFSQELCRFFEETQLLV